MAVSWLAACRVLCWLKLWIGVWAQRVCVFELCQKALKGSTYSNIFALLAGRQAKCMWDGRALVCKTQTPVNVLSKSFEADQ